jgi:pimeloyl-ACP methyl ester carboxylesterase
MHTGEITVQGIRSPLIEVGSPDAAEAVVFLHGNPGSHQDWLDLVPAAGEVGRALAFDLPGFGRAGKPRDFDHTVEGYARWVGAALAELRVGRAHLVMHDFGVAFGLMWGVEHPDGMASVTLINSGVMPGYRWHRNARIWRTPVLGELSMLATTPSLLKRGLNRQNPRPMPGWFLDRVAHDFDRATKRAVLRLYRATDVGGELAERARGALRALDPPALVVWGAEDPFADREWAHRQRETFPSARVAMLEGLGHWPFIDDLQAVEVELVPFLREQVGRR